MRRIPFVLIALAATAALACDDEPLVGPAAEQAFERAVAGDIDLPDSVLVYLDDVRVDRSALDTLPADRIARIEVIKGQAAVDGFGARQGVIQIYTKVVLEHDAPPGPHR